MAIETVLSDTAKEILHAEGFLRYSANYVGCPVHGACGFACPTDTQGNCLCRNGRFWVIDGMDAKVFVASIKAPAITYVFAEKTGEVRKIGEGYPRRILENLRAHYNHGTTKASRTISDRSSGNSIARRCRLAGEFFLYVRTQSSKQDAQRTEGKIKAHLSGWLDYDQGRSGIPATL